MEVVALKARCLREKGRVIGWWIEVTKSDGSKTGMGRGKTVCWPNRKAVEDEIRRLERSVEDGQDLFASNIRFKDYAESVIARRILMNGWRPKYAADVRRWMTRVVFPMIGNVEVRKLTPSHIEQVLLEVADLADSTINTVRAAMSVVCKRAVRDRLLTANPVSLADRPKSTKRTKERYVPTDAEVARILEKSESTIWALPVLLSATTGCRRSEICGLQWGDVDLDAGLIRIERGLHWVPVGEGKRELRTQPPKSERSQRVVTLPGFVCDRLRAHRKDQLERRLAAGEVWQEGDWVLDRGDGRPIDVDSYAKAFVRIAVEAGVPQATLHSLRHAFATSMVDVVNAKVLQSLIGHSDPNFTIRQYVAARQEGFDAAREAQERRFGAR